MNRRQAALSSAFSVQRSSFPLTLRRLWRRSQTFDHPFGGVPAMKRLLAPAALLLAAALTACTTTTDNTNTGAVNTNANANANANAAATPAAVTQADIEA